MWFVENNTPYQAERTWVRDKYGVHHWIVVVKATYDIGDDGALTLSKEPVDPLYAPEYNGEDGQSSIKYEADLVAMKPGTDVLLNGTAYAPIGETATRMKVTLEVKDIKKTLYVYGDRLWERGLSGPEPSYPAPFETMPIVYERAFGGFDQTDEDPKNHRLDFRNPFGLGYVFNHSTLYGNPAPNIEYPRGALSKDGPAGFGAIPSFCSPRRAFAGTYDDHWQTTKAPLLPDNYDPRWLLSSPIDQRPRNYLRGGEVVRLTNLTPSGYLHFVLPEVFLFFSTHIDGKQYDHHGKLVTVVIEPDLPRLILTWQTSLEVRQNVDYLDKTVVTEKTMQRFDDIEDSLCRDCD
jgi:hypothetical protein